MTRTLFLGAGLLLLLTGAGFVGGVAGNAPGALFVSLLCGVPFFMLLLGAALGRASNEFTIRRRETSHQGRSTRVQAQSLGEPIR